MKRTLVCASAALLSLALWHPAQAQQHSPTEGVAAPLPSLVDRSDALSLELNPAGLAHLEGFDLGLVYHQSSDDLRQGTAALLAFELFDGFGLGYSLQFMDTGALQDPHLAHDYRKHSLGLGLGGDLSLGLAWNLLGSSHDPALDKLSGWDLGLQYRINRWLGLAMAARDLNAPFLDGVAIHPQVSFGAALRFWEGRLLLESQARLRADDDRLYPRLLAAVEPLDGVRLFGHVELDTDRSLRDQRQLRAFLGLELNTGALGVASGGSLGDVTGAGLAVRLSSVPHRSLFSPPRTFQRIELRGNLSERQGRDLLGRPVGTSFLSLLRALDKMGQDPNVDGVVLDIEDVSMGYGQLWELRTRILALRDAGKKVVAYLNSTSQRDYYLATAADKVFMGPSLTFDARGLALTQSYFRAALDKIGVQPQFIRIAEYKSAPESYTRESPSEPAEEALNAFLDAVWQHMLTAMAEGRGLPPGQMEGLIQTAPHTPDQALQEDLVDRILYADELPEALRELYPGASMVDHKPQRQKSYDWGRDPIIAVIHIDGNIVTGDGGVNPVLGGVSTGDEAIRKITDWASRNSQVRAVVVRIDSPGGSAIASDRIFRHLRKLSEKKPVLVSMGDIAASGGYYAAAAGQEIYCSPTTLTGSIGIFSGKFALDQLYQKVGYHSVTQKRGQHADLYSLDKPWDEEEQRVIRDQITYLYELFLSQVSAGRDMPRDEIHEVARGRIWSGIDAQRVGLCDKHGGLLDTLQEAARRADLDLDHVRIASLPNGASLSPLGLVPSLHTGQLSEGFLATWDQDQAQDDQARYDAYAPLRHLMAPLRTAATLGVLYKDGEALALLPFRVEGW